MQKYLCEIESGLLYGTPYSLDAAAYALGMPSSPVYLLIWTKCPLNSLLASKIMSLVL